jgi:hypothetical protein
MPEARTPRYLHRSPREWMFGFSLIDFMVLFGPFVMSGTYETRSF